MKDPDQWWWLSFAGEKSPLGVIFSQGADIKDAIKKTALLGINPGGEVLGHPLLDEDALEEMREMGPNRLIAPDELDTFGYEMRNDVIDTVNSSGQSFEEFEEDEGTQLVSEEENADEKEFTEKQERNRIKFEYKNIGPKKHAPQYVLKGEEVALKPEEDINGQK
jgi:hypothetical protein